MQTYFYELAQYLETQLRGSEIYTATFNAEDSDFVRFNHAEVRQAMHITQRELGLRLIDGRRHLAAGLTLSGEKDVDHARCAEAVTRLRAMLPHLPEDPFLLYSTDVRSSERTGQNALPPATEAVGDILSVGGGSDFVGIYASGGIFNGFANSLGQRNWFSTYSHNLDWSVYHHGDKAVKDGYAGFTWDGAILRQKIESAREQLVVLGQTPRTIDPGQYRVYLAPAAVNEMIGMLAWGGFGLKDHQTRQTPLLRMVEEDARLHDSISLAENTREGVAADFQDSGFIKPDVVPMIQGGKFQTCLASPRSAQEYGVPTNGAGDEESPESLDLAGGALPKDNLLSELGTGLYVNNLHYLNYSDRPACRITGMTRFATFWVEKGRIQAPVNVMRFDETIYRVLGENLAGLTQDREFLLDPHSYGRRSTASGRMPGALIEDFTFTL